MFDSTTADSLPSLQHNASSFSESDDIRKMSVDYCFPEILRVCRNGKYILELNENKYERLTRE